MCGECDEKLIARKTLDSHPQQRTVFQIERRGSFLFRSGLADVFLLFFRQSRPVVVRDARFKFGVDFDVLSITVDRRTQHFIPRDGLANGLC